MAAVVSVDVGLCMLLSPVDVVLVRSRTLTLDDHAVARSRARVAATHISSYWRVKSPLLWTVHYVHRVRELYSDCDMF